MPQPNQLLEGLFRPVEQQPRENPLQPATMAAKGDLLLFAYQFWLHDPYPLVIVTDCQPRFRIRGLNLHYLTFTNMRWLLRVHSGNRMFSYQTVKGNMFLRDAFRWYKWEGIRSMRKMDPKYLTGMMGSVRGFDPVKTRLIQDAVREQLGRQLNATATEMTGRGIYTGNQSMTGRPVPVAPQVPVVGGQQGT